MDYFFPLNSYLLVRNRKMLRILYYFILKVPKCRTYQSFGISINSFGDPQDNLCHAQNTVRTSPTEFLLRKICRVGSHADFEHRICVRNSIILQVLPRVPKIFGVLTDDHQLMTSSAWEITLYVTN